jgi:gamma-tubulin complex component 3
MFVFQGIDGHYITYNPDLDRYVLNELIPWNENIVEIVGVLSELGWLYKKVSNFLNYFNNNNEINFQFLQSFCYSIQNELNEYYKLISFFKKKNGESDLNNENNNINNINNSNSNIINNKNIISKNNDLTLKNLFLWTIEPIERMKWLSIACDSVYNLKDQV